MDDKFAVSQYKLKKANADYVDLEEEMQAFKDENERLTAQFSVIDQKNKDLFWSVRQSLDLSGQHEQADIKMITASFHKGEERDGVGLLNWALTVNDYSTVAAQSKAREKWTSLKLTASDRTARADSVTHENTLSRTAK